MQDLVKLDLCLPLQGLQMARFSQKDWMLKAKIIKSLKLLDSTSIMKIFLEGDYCQANL